MAGERDGLSPGEKWLIGLTITVVTLVGGAGWWWYESSVMPTYTPPLVAMPAVNANDDFARAGLLCKPRVGRITEDAVYHAISPSGEYKQSQPSFATRDEFDAYVKANEPAYQAMRKGFGKPHYDPTDKNYPKMPASSSDCTGIGDTASDGMVIGKAP